MHRRRFSARNYRAAAAIADNRSDSGGIAVFVFYDVSRRTTRSWSYDKSNGVLDRTKDIIRSAIFLFLRYKYLN
jgi:hypothetical protein